MHNRKDKECRYYVTKEFPDYNCNLTFGCGDACKKITVKSFYSKPEILTPYNIVNWIRSRKN